jgi:hypothetical protein
MARARLGRTSIEWEDGACCCHLSLVLDPELISCTLINPNSAQAETTPMANKSTATPPPQPAEAGIGTPCPTQRPTTSSHLLVSPPSCLVCTRKVPGRWGNTLYCYGFLTRPPSLFRVLAEMLALLTRIQSSTAERMNRPPPSLPPGLTAPATNSQTHLPTSPTKPEPKSTIDPLPSPLGTMLRATPRQQFLAAFRAS